MASMLILSRRATFLFTMVFLYAVAVPFILVSFHVAVVLLIMIHTEGAVAFIIMAFLKGTIALLMALFLQVGISFTRAACPVLTITVMIPVIKIAYRSHSSSREQCDGRDTYNDHSK
jgi:hypothetical protein